MRKPLFTVPDSIIKKFPYVIGTFTFLALIFTIFRPESSNFTWIEFLIGFLLILSSTLGLIVFIASKQEIPKSLFYFFLFIFWSIFTIFLSFHNGVNFIFWARKYFPIFIFPMMAISTMSIFKTQKQIKIIYISLFLIATIAFFKSFLPLLFINISSIARCDIFRNYSGWGNGLLIFSLIIPIILHNKITNKFLKIILYFIVCISIFSLAISLTRTYWAGAIVSILFTSFLIARSVDGHFFRSFLSYIIKISIGISLIAILTYMIFPGNIKYCFLNRIDSLVNLFKDPAVRERVSESKGALNSLTQTFPSENIVETKNTSNNFIKTSLTVETKNTSNNFIKTSLTVLVGNGLGSKFTYNSVVTGKDFYVESDFSHNYFIYLLWTTGIIGLFLFLFASYSLLLQIRRSISNFYADNDMLPYFIGIITTLAVAFIISFIGSPLFLYEWAVYYGIILGLGLSLINLHKNSEAGKVVIVHNIVSPYKVYLFNALNLVLNNFEVIFIAKSEKIREWKFDEKELKFKYKILFDSNIENINSIRLNLRLLKALNESNPDTLIIDGYSYFYCWIAMIWGKIKGKKLSLWFSSTYNDHKRYLFKKVIKRLFIRRFDSANTYSIKSKEYLEWLGMSSSKIFTIGNVTDNDYYYNECEKYKNNGVEIKKEYGFANHNFLYVGRFSKEKNVLVLLEALKDVISSKKIGDWGLILVGNGPQEEEIKEFIKKYNLDNYIKMVGFKQKEEICKFYSVSDVLVLPSLSETWGMVVNEAMVCGLAILVSRNCGCYPDIVKDGINGCSFDPANVDELKNILIKFISNEVDIENLKANSLNIIKNYTPESAANIIKKTIEII